VNARWPRFMKRKTAAEYCDMTEAAFEKEVMAGRLPCAVVAGGRDHWDRQAIDAAISRIAGNDDEPAYLKEFNARYG
jgi:hypothetical protein